MHGPQEETRHSSAYLLEEYTRPTVAHKAKPGVTKARTKSETFIPPSQDQQLEEPITVAAIIPLFNGGLFIEAAIESVIGQTDPPNEIIVVDDGSTDDGPEIVRRLQNKYPIILLKKANGGQSSARNFAISLTRCTHIALLDQDDLWYPHHIATLKKSFLEQKNRKLGFVYSNLDRIDKAGCMVKRNFLDEVPSSHPKMSVLDCVARDMFVLPGASMFSKQAWSEVGGFDERLSGYEDDDFFFRIFRAGYASEYLKDHSLTQWRIYPTSTSFSPRMAKSRMIYFRKLMELLPDEPSLHLFWARDAIGPRFVDNLRSELIRASRIRDVNRVGRCWNDLKEIVPVLKRRTKRRVRLLAPIIDCLHTTRFQGMTRFAVRAAFRA